MSNLNLMSPARKALLDHLAALPDDRILLSDQISAVAGISPRSELYFRNLMIEEGLLESVRRGPGLEFGVRITTRGREAMKNAVLPEDHETRKTHDRSEHLAEIVADPLTVRANVADLYRHLVEGQPAKVAAHNLNQVEQLLALLNGVMRLHTRGA